MSENEFFVGWQEKVPNSNRKAIKKFIILVFVVITLVAFLFVLNQKDFRDHIFQLGNITVIEGIYFSDPVPMLHVDDPSWKSDLSRNILLVGYGKSGAEGIMEEISQSMGNINGRKIKIQGTVISGDGHTLLELTRKEKSVIQLFDNTVDPYLNNEKLQVHLNGEIVDPKCYFGVMKPGEGKVHKSCAIRCISGGIPPVLKVEDSTSRSYYILIGNNGQKINKSLLQYIAEPVKITGKASTINGWNFLEVDIKNITLL